MKNNFVAKNAQISGSGFHSEKRKPEVSAYDLTVRCGTCDTYSEIDKSELECPVCGSSTIIKIGGSR